MNKSAEITSALYDQTWQRLRRELEEEEEEEQAQQWQWPQHKSEERPGQRLLLQVQILVYSAFLVRRCRADGLR